MWGGTVDDTSGVDFTAALAAVQAQAMAGENGRRQLAAERPGHGAQVPLPQPPAGPGVGISDVPLPVMGEGYESTPVASEAVSAAFAMPNYAPAEVGGVGFVGGGQEAPVRVSVGQRSTPGDGVTIVSAPSRPSLLSRLLGRMRGRG
jgi:hypothetical protein